MNGTNVTRDALSARGGGCRPPPPTAYIHFFISFSENGLRFAWQKCRVSGEGDWSALPKLVACFPIKDANIGTHRPLGARAPFAYPGRRRRPPTAQNSKSNAS